jgi:LPS-assembly protein
MKQLYKFKLNYFFSGILMAVILSTLTWKTSAGYIHTSDFRRPLTITCDTTKPTLKTDSISNIINAFVDTTKPPGKDSSIVKEKIDTFSLKISKDSLDAPLKYAAADSVVVLIQDKKILLYGKTRTDYKDITLTAPRVELDQQTQIVTAVNRKDSSGQVLEPAHFKNGENEFTSDTIRYNFKTQIGLTKNTYTEQGEFLVIGDDAKKVSENVTFVKRARFTTCLLDEPHFDFVTPKMKVVNKKIAVSGPTHLEFEGVPIPIYLPFGFFPLSQGRHSGFLPPQFTTNEQYGLGLEGMGYYKVLSDYWDVQVRTNIYSYGGWAANVNPTYRKRYRYSGAFTLSMQSTKQNFKGDPDFSKNKTYAVSWSHSVDSRARPGTVFSANLNASSTKYNRYVSNDPRLNFQNQQGSSIAYSKSWAGKPYNLTVSANHNQNNLTHIMNISLPDVGFSVSTLYPFEKKESAGTVKWFEKLGVGYNGNFRNQLSFYDTVDSKKVYGKTLLAHLLDTLQWGAQHNFPLTVALPPILGGAVIVSPGISYSQVWIAQKFRRSWNAINKKVDTTITKGFFMDHQATFSLNFNTAIFGVYQFKKSRILAIRHVIRPTLSMNYKPDLSKSHFYKTQLDTTGYVNPFPYSEFEGALYSGFSYGQNGGLSFQLDNNLEMKWRSRKDSGEKAIKKIRLIDGYGFSGSYNFLADSMKLSHFNLYLRTTLFEKISINAVADLDPYMTDRRGYDSSKYAWQGGKFKPGRLTSGGISISANFKSKAKDPKKEEERKKQVQQRLNDPNLVADQQRLMDYMQQNPAEFVDFNIPWQVSFGYSLAFNNNRQKPDYSGFELDFASNINFNGSFNLSPKWNFSATGYYDFHTRKLQTFSMSISREMHCWQMSINITPVGLYRYFSFSISPKASVLQDLKVNRTRSFPNF